MKKFIIFLDFDGPIYPKKALFLKENNGQESIEMCQKLDLHPSVKYWKMDPCAVSMLNKLFENDNVQVVVSSSWANPILHNKEQIVNLFKANGLNAILHNNWNTAKKGSHRTEDIYLWLEDNKEEVQDYIIFDDNISAPEMENHQIVKKFKIEPYNIFLVPFNDGISYQDFITIQERVSNK